MQPKQGVTSFYLHSEKLTLAAKKRDWGEALTAMVVVEAWAEGSGGLRTPCTLPGYFSQGAAPEGPGALSTA